MTITKILVKKWRSLLDRRSSWTPSFGGRLVTWIPRLRKDDSSKQCKEYKDAIQEFEKHIIVDIESGQFFVELVLPRIDALEFCDDHLASHIPGLSSARRVKERVMRCLEETSRIVCDLCDAGRVMELRDAFDTYSRVARLWAALPPMGGRYGKHDGSGKKCRDAVHGSLLRCIEDLDKALDAALEKFDFAECANVAQRFKTLGFFMISTFALYHDDLELKKTKDDVVGKLTDRVHELFGDPAMTKIGRCFGVLGLDRDANLQQVKRRYNQLARQLHPDKCSAEAAITGGAKERTQLLNDAKEHLDDAANRAIIAREDYKFLKRVGAIPSRLRETFRDHLDDDAYDKAVALYGRLLDLSFVADMTRPPLDVAEITAATAATIKSHIAGLRTKVDSAWTERKLVDLQRYFRALDRVEASFSSYNEIYSQAWNRDVFQSIEDEIGALATDLRGVLPKGGRQELKATAKVDEFALKLIRLGRILDGLPRFKKQTRSQIQQVLDDLQQRSWGVTFLFKLGLALEQGRRGDNDDDDQVGKSIVNEFRHFADTMTWTWNEEVVQKDPAQSIDEMQSEVFLSKTVPSHPRGLDKNVADALRSAYKRYEAEYDRLFQKHISDDVDTSGIVAIVMDRAADLWPCTTGDWNDRIVAAVPLILAGVFAFFTISRSGDSFNRLQGEDGDSGDPRILM